MVWVPMTRPEAPRYTGVPDIVTAGLLGRIVVPWMRNPVGLAVMIWSPTEKMDEGGLEGRKTVCVPMTSSDDPKDTGVPDIVVSAPRVTKVPAIKRPRGLVVIVLVCFTNTKEGSFKVDSTLIEGLKEASAPETIKTDPPCVKVVPAKKNVDGRSGGVEETAGFPKGMVPVLTGMPDLPRETCVPEVSTPCIDVVLEKPGIIVSPPTTTRFVDNCAGLESDLTDSELGMV